jgi:hypothetical protein
MDAAWIRPLGLVVLAACGAPEFESDVKPHAIDYLNSGDYPEVTRTRGSYAERACAVKPTEDPAKPCEGAMAPRANEPLDCTATFMFQGIQGCCVPYHDVSTPMITDRVYFFECPK